MYRLLHRLSIASVPIIFFALDGAGAVTAQPVTEIHGIGVASAQSLEAPRGMPATPESQVAPIAMGNSYSMMSAQDQAVSLTTKNASNGLSLVGALEATFVGSGMRFKVDHIVNSRSSGSSGSLRLALWATTTVPIFGNTIQNYTLATYNLNPLNHGFQYNNVDSGEVPYTAPPSGCYYLTLALLEFQSGA